MFLLSNCFTVAGDSRKVPAHLACSEHQYRWANQDSICTHRYQGIQICSIFV